MSVLCIGFCFLFSTSEGMESKKAWKVKGGGSCDAPRRLQSEIPTRPPQRGRIKKIIFSGKACEVKFEVLTEAGSGDAYSRVKCEIPTRPPQRGRVKKMIFASFFPYKVKKFRNISDGYHCNYFF